MKFLRASCLLGIIVAAGGHANTEIKVSTTEGISAAESQGLGVDDMAYSAKQSANTSPTYIIRLKDPAVARYQGAIAGFAATSPAVTGAKRLDVNSQDSKRYAQMLEGKQNAMLEHCEQSLGRDLKVKYQYQHVFNGVAVEISAEEAKMIEQMPEVHSVIEAGYETTLSDVGPQWIGADALWNADGHTWPPQVSTQGEGVVVAIIDSGVNSDHPSFADIGGDGYDHENPLGSGNYIPGSYCDTVKPEFCNDKVIGAWSFTLPDVDPISPEDNRGHGSHVAGTVAGNVIEEAVISAPTTELNRRISGVAPHANLIIYDACIVNDANRGVCPLAGLLAAIEQVVIDAATLPNGIQAINYSISGGASPYGDPVELGFLNATAAGIYVSASAGNNGPDVSTVAHNSPWVATVAAMTHNRKFVNNLENISSDEGSLEDISAVGLTTSYGPAPIVYAGDFPTTDGSENETNPAQCLDPFPAGHFNGEIVVCDRGSIARVAKGRNVLAGGAGGFVLANAESNGESTSADPHALPGVHIGFADGVRLKDWMLTQTNATASISGFSADLSNTNGDIMADFSSRGPYTENNVLKPDIAAPGVSVLAAVETEEGSTGPEYGFLSGTSMSSPHHAGSVALLASIRPDWTPYELKSAIMMSAKNDDMRKEDGETPADHFDVGAGRVDLTRIQNVGLVLNETPENFLASDPAIGGDPKTLNIASMQDSACVGECTWQRTVKNASERFGVYRLSGEGPEGLKLNVRPRFLALRPGEEAEIQVRANSSVAQADWNFANLNLSSFGFGNQPDLHMPITVRPATTSDANFINMTVDKAEASRRDILNYEITITNELNDGPIDLSNALPRNLRVVRDSLSQEIVNGESISDFSYSRGELSWNGMLARSDLEIVEDSSPAGYVALSEFAEPFGCPSNCDDGAWILTVPEFTFNGKKYTRVIWSINGTLQVGEGSRRATTAASVGLPDTQEPNNLLAPFWTDLNMGENGDGAELYTAVLDIGEQSYSVYEWNNVPLFSDAESRYTFQIWIENGDSGNIWYVYHELGTTTPETGQVSVGVENNSGEVGDTYFYDGEGQSPAVGVDLRVATVPGGSATLSFQAKLKHCFGRDAAIVNRANTTTESSEETAIAVTRCVR